VTRLQRVRVIRSGSSGNLLRQSEVSCAKSRRYTEFSGFCGVFTKVHLVARRRLFLTKIRVALIGVGNCSSSLVQGVGFYRDAVGEQSIPGIMHLDLGGYHVGDIEFVAAFDVAKGKVGRDLSEAIAAPPNNTERFAKVRPTGIEVLRGPTHDGIGQYLRDVVIESPELVDDVADTLRRSGAEIVVSHLPVGSEVAARWYAEQALRAGCGLVNCIPVFIATDPR
jgi:myo-inositol-1-phosphate synthase